MNETMTKEQEQLYRYLIWLSFFVERYRDFIIKYNNSDNNEIQVKSLHHENIILQEKDKENIQMLKILFNIIAAYIKQNNEKAINDTPKEEISKNEYNVVFNNTYFKIGKDVNDTLVYIQKSTKKGNNFIDLENLVGIRKNDSKYNNLKIIENYIDILIKSGVSIMEIRKSIDSYLDKYETKKLKEKKR